MTILRLTVKGKYFLLGLIVVHRLTLFLRTINILSYILLNLEIKVKLIFLKVDTWNLLSPNPMGGSRIGDGLLENPLCSK